MNIGQTTIVATAYSVDADCTPITTQVTVTRTTTNVCTAPVNFLTITTPVSGTTFITGSILLSGTVDSDAVSVQVNGVLMSLSGTTRSGMITITP